MYCCRAATPLLLINHPITHDLLQDRCVARAGGEEGETPLQLRNKAFNGCGVDESGYDQCVVVALCAAHLATRSSKGPTKSRHTIAPFVTGSHPTRALAKARAARSLALEEPPARPTTPPPPTPPPPASGGSRATASRAKAYCTSESLHTLLT